MSQNNASTPQQEEPQQQQQQQQQQQALSAQATSVLRAPNGQQGFAFDPNALAAAMLQQQQQQQQQQVKNDTHSITNEIKRLQSLQQMNTAGVQGNALLMPGGQRTTTGDGNASLLQSMMDSSQKVPNPRFDNPLAQTMGINPMLQPGFFQDARMFMAQNQLAAAASRTSAEMPLPSPHSLFHRDGSRRMRGGVIEPFPEKLHRLLMEVEAAGRSDVISFVADGRAFAIHKPDKFFKEIVPLYFRQSRLSSFKRQLNLYGFELVNTGPARGGYYHELFVKDRPELCRRMRRVAVKVSTKNDNKSENKETVVEEATDKVEENADGGGEEAKAANEEGVA